MESLGFQSTGWLTGHDPAAWDLSMPRMAHPGKAHPQSFLQIPVLALPSVAETIGTKSLQEHIGKT